MVSLIPVPQAHEDGLSGLLVGLPHQHRLEAPLQGGVLLNIFTVLLGGGGADDLDLPPAQGRFDDVGRVNGSLGGARPHDGMELVDEEDHIPHPAHLGQHVFHPLLKFAPVLGARHHGGQIQGDQALAPQFLGYVARHHHPGQALGHRRLAHAGLPDEGGVVLLPPGQDLDHPADLLVPAHHRVQLAPGSHAGQVPGKLLQQLGLSGVVPLGAGLAAPPERRRLGLAPHGGGHVRPQAAGLHPGGVQHPHRHTIPLPEDAQQQMLGAHILVAQPHRLGEGELNDLLAPWGQPLRGDGPRRAHPHQLGHRFFQALRLQAGGLEDLGGYPPPLPGQAQQQVFAAHIAVAQLRRALLGQPQGSLGPLGESGLIHALASPVLPPREEPAFFLDGLHTMCHAPSPLFCADGPRCWGLRSAGGSNPLPHPCGISTLCPSDRSLPAVHRIYHFSRQKKIYPQYTHFSIAILKSYVTIALALKFGGVSNGLCHQRRLRELWRLRGRLPRRCYRSGR